ncbi:hypothetical protein ABZ570_25585 [Micromonospora sp. NPDC007271]|uniref:hypothetical protein n=1 Tax=Micromonospora sp. NPDC007271 TaxID=3154587 RepID=UPI00340BD085
MTDLDQRIASVLRERAEGEIDTDRLLDRSRAVGRRRRVRRRAATGTTLALVGVLGFAAMAGPDLPGLPGRLPWTAATPAVAVPVPPPVDGAPGAAQRPELVGTDPQTLHFGVDPAKARQVTWRSGRGVEGSRLDLGGGRQVALDLSTDVVAVEESVHEGMTYPDRPATAADFDGRIRRVPPSGPGGQPGWFLRWQPVPGLFARVHTVGADDRALREAVAAVRLDEAHKCASPLRLTTLPPDARLASCEVSVIGFPDSLDLLLTVNRPEDQRLDVRLEYRSRISGSRSEGNRTIGSRAAYLYPQGGELELLGIPKAHLTVRFGWPNQGFTEADATTVLAGAQVAKDLSDPETWD